jgi:hypothetical protein
MTERAVRAGAVRAPNPNLSEIDPIESLRDRSTKCGRFWTEGLPYWLLAEVCLALADKIDALEARLGGTP